MRTAKNDEIESEVYDEFLAIDLTEQQESIDNSDLKPTKGRSLNDATNLLSSGVICSALCNALLLS